MEFFPGRSGRRAPYGSCGATQLFTTNGWFYDKSPYADFAGVRLSCSIGNTVGWLGYASYVALEALDGRSATLTGYPGDRAPATMWTHSGTIRRARERHVFYKLDSFSGQSGSPVYSYQDPPGTDVYTGQPLGSGWYGMAVHSYGTALADKPCPCNSGPRITGTRVTMIYSWTQ